MRLLHRALVHEVDESVPQVRKALEVAGQIPDSND